MLTIVFDFRTIHHEAQFYRYLATKSHCPADFGSNLDALWDWLTGGMALPAHLALNHLPAASDPSMQRILPVLTAAAAELPGLLTLSYDGNTEPAADWQALLSRQN